MNQRPKCETPNTETSRIKQSTLHDVGIGKNFLKRITFA